jgi:hypothetical protein
MDNLASVVATISSIITMVVVLVALYYAHRQVKEAALSRNMAFLWDFFKEYRDKARAQFREDIFKGQLDVDNLDLENACKLQQELDDLEFLGLMLRLELVTIDWIAPLLYYSPAALWEKCKDGYIINDRRINEQAFRQFEFLVGQINANAPSKVQPFVRLAARGVSGP